MRSGGGIGDGDGRGWWDESLRVWMGRVEEGEWKKAFLEKKRDVDMVHWRRDACAAPTG